MERQNPDIHFLPRAEDDIDEILTFMHEEKYSGIQKFFDELQATIERLSFFPRLGHFSEDIRIRKLKFRVLRFKQYSIYYKIENSEVLICRVLHNSRDNDELLNN